MACVPSCYVHMHDKGVGAVTVCVDVMHAVLSHCWYTFIHSIPWHVYQHMFAYNCIHELSWYSHLHMTCHVHTHMTYDGHEGARHDQTQTITWLFRLTASGVLNRATLLPAGSSKKVHRPVS